MNKARKVRKTVALPEALYVAACKRIESMKEVNWSIYIRLLVAKEVAEQLLKK
jgi:hypothetical protein